MKVPESIRAGDRELFLKWALLTALALVFIVGLGIAYGGKVSGPSRVAVPIILLVYAYASQFAGRLAWRAGGEFPPGEVESVRLIHESRYLLFFAWLVQMLGIMATVLGFWLLLSGSANDTALHAKIIDGGGVALIGTFMGIFTSLIITATHRMIEHDLEG